MRCRFRVPLVGMNLIASFTLDDYKSESEIVYCSLLLTNAFLGFNLLAVTLQDVHWVPLTTSREIQKKILVVSELFNVAAK